MEKFLKSLFSVAGSKPLYYHNKSLNFTWCRYFHCTRHVSQVRVRFAPSPTGQLHLGGLRTALYNYLFAKSKAGSFILRIEDTDQTRAVKGSVERLIAMLTWAGIHPDEGPGFGGSYGPYVQSQRMQLYQESVKTLIENGTAYPCFCSNKRLDLVRKDALRRNETPKYDNKCRYLSKEEVQAKLNDGVEHCIRFKLTPFTEAWHDVVFGPISYDISTVEGDPVIMKMDGYPTYHFANVVDDHHMQISHVFRGVEWQVSTPKHILLYHAFGWSPPKFGHLPLILNRDGTKLSKRQNDIHVEHLKNVGYFPEAVINLLTSMGSGFKVKSHETIGMHMDQLIKNFEIENLRTNSTHLDLRQLEAHNQLHLNLRLNDQSQRKELISDLKDVVLAHFGKNVPADCLSDTYLSNVFDYTKDRISVLSDLLQPDFQFVWQPPDISQLQLPQLGIPLLDIIDITLHTISELPEFTSKDLLTARLKQLTKDKKLKFGSFMKLLRNLLSGLQEGQPVAEMMIILGKPETEKRLLASRAYFIEAKEAK